MQTNRECHTCGKKYYYCYSCPTEQKPLYNIMFCSEECNMIFDTLTEYNFKRLTAKEAYDKIKDYLPEDISNYSYGSQKLIKQIKEELAQEEKQQASVYQEKIVQGKKPVSRNKTTKSK